MRRRLAFIFALFAAVFCCLFYGLYKKPYTTYDITAELDDKNMEIKCTQKIKYINTEDCKIDTLYFHIYPNAFRYKSKVPIPRRDFPIAYPNGFSSGYLNINKVKVGDKDAKYSIEGTDETILKVHLGKTLNKKQKEDVYIEFTVKLPNCEARFGYGENSINVTNWYPILCVYDDTGWNLDPYYYLGDPFYSDVSNYKVNIIVPKEYTIAYTGKLDREINLNGKVKNTINAFKVRDFAWFASNKYEVVENKIDNITIKSYNYSPYGEKSVEIASRAIDTFNNMFGKYPYDTFSTAESDFYIGGMEYPQIVQIDTRTFSSYNLDNLWLEYLMVHEIAHQWWYGVVGNDEVDEPWLDEGLTEYSTILYFEKNYGKTVKNEVMDLFVMTDLKQFRINNQKREIINKSLNEFENWQEYSALVYSKGAVLHDELRKLIGDEKYFKLLKKYYKNFKFKNASAKDFVSMANTMVDEDIEEFFIENLGKKF